MLFVAIVIQLVMYLVVPLIAASLWLPTAPTSSRLGHVLGAVAIRLVLAMPVGFSVVCIVAMLSSNDNNPAVNGVSFLLSLVFRTAVWLLVLKIVFRKSYRGKVAMGLSLGGAVVSGLGDLITSNALQTIHTSFI